jgi:glycosyltransferase involved in cell wall biosynthesis
MTNAVAPLNILHLASSERWTGVAEPLTSLAQEQEKLGHRVWIGCVPGSSFEETVRARGLETVEQFHLNRRMHPLHFISDLRGIPAFCRRNRVDVVHCHLLHDHWLAGISLGGLKRRSGNGRPLLMRTSHASLPPRSDWLHRWLFLRRTDGLVCISGEAAERAASAFGLAKDAFSHAGGGVDLGRFHPDLDRTALRRELGIPLDSPVAGIISRVRAGRGVRWLMRSIPLLLERVPEAHVVIVGRGELKQWFREEMVKPIYRGQVHNAGFRKDDLPQAYAALDTTLFLGLGSEGTCRAILEAMACGRPTIGSTVGAVPEIIEDGQTGLLARDRSAEDLSEKMIEMLSDREQCARMGQAARRRAERHFTEAARALSVQRIYERLLARKA